MSEGRLVRSLNATLRRLADRFTTPRNPVRRALSPAYSSLLAVLTAGRGYPAEINGQVFRMDPRFRWSVWDSHEPVVAEYLRQHIKPGDTCFDIGANIGAYVLQMARWSAPDGRIVAFEPNPSTIPVLQRHVRMNGLESRVTVVPAAVGARAGTAPLYDDAPGSRLSRIGAPHPGTQVSLVPTSISVMTIDDYCRETGITPDWMLIDVEGYEYEVLQGAADTFRRHRPRVVMELHEHVVSSESRAAGERLLRELEWTAQPIGIVEGRRETFVTFG